MYNLFLFLCFFFFHDTATTEIYTLSLHDALPIYGLVPELGEESNRELAHPLLLPAVDGFGFREQKLERALVVARVATEPLSPPPPSPERYSASARRPARSAPTQHALRTTARRHRGPARDRERAHARLSRCSAGVPRSLHGSGGPDGLRIPFDALSALEIGRGAGERINGDKRLGLARPGGRYVKSLITPWPNP